MALLRTSQLRAITFAALTAAAVFAIPSTAQAEKVQPTAKGTIGGAFLGGEIVVFGEALFGVRSPVAYIVGAGVGAVGGGVGGFFIEKAVDDGRIPAYMLAGGLALLIPALVVAFDATRYLPTEGAREDKPVNVPPSDPGKPGGSSVVGAEPGGTAPGTPTPPGSTPTPAPTDSAAPPAPPAPAPSTTPPGGPGGGGNPSQSSREMHPGDRTSLIGLRVQGGEGQFRVGLPLPEVRPVLGAAERARLGAENKGSEVRFPVVRVTF